MSQCIKQSAGLARGFTADGKEGEKVWNEIYPLRKDQPADNEDADQVYGAEPIDIPSFQDLA